MIDKVHPSILLWVAALAVLMGLPWWLLAGEQPDVPINPLPIMPDIEIAQSQSPNNALSSPVFEKSRQRSDSLETGNQDEAEQSDSLEIAADTQPQTAPVLLGVIKGKGNSAAAILRDNDGAQQIVKQGNSIDGWRIAAIGRNSVTIDQNGQELRLRLEFPATGLGGAGNAEHENKGSSDLSSGPDRGER